MLLALASPTILTQRAGVSVLSQAPAAPVTLGQSVVALTGPWKFHIGDDPRWSDKDFDDSNWEHYDLAPGGESLPPERALQLEKLPGWQHHGHPGHAGYGWYRMQLNVQPMAGPFAFLMPQNAEDAYEVYLNGQLIGKFGKLDGFHLTYDGQPKLFFIPAAISNTGKPLILAIRFWSMPREESSPAQNVNGGLRGVPLIGSSALLRVFEKSTEEPLPNGWHIQESIFGYLVQPSLYIGIGLISIFLFSFGRGQREYLWASIALAGRGLLVAAILMEEAHQIAYQPSDVIQQIALWASVFSMPQAAMWLLSVPRSRWRWANYFVTALFVIDSLKSLGVELGWLSPNGTLHVIDEILKWTPRSALALLLLLIAVDGIRTIGRKAWFLMAPGILFGAHMVVYMFVTDFMNGLGILDAFLSAGVPVSVLFIFLIRFTKQQRENGRMLEDMRQAREVQQFLIPEKMPDISGWKIESEYRPAREVGGDFFQIIPDHDEGSLLIVAGDVTGKGVQAGMLVALLVGAIRTEWAHTSDPTRILRVLNSRLCGREHAQATCLAIHLTSNGQATLANAGHLPPYLNCEPLAMEGSLPLGMIDAAEFSVMQFELKPNDRLVLVSDGIVEAQNANGALFGFERLQALLRSAESAGEVASAAQRFGQEDDISVIVVTHTGSPELASA